MHRLWFDTLLENSGWSVGVSEVSISQVSISILWDCGSSTQLLRKGGKFLVTLRADPVSGLVVSGHCTPAREPPS